MELTFDLTVDLYQPLCGYTTHNLQSLGDNRTSLLRRKHASAPLTSNSAARLTLAGTFRKKV
jgi:hypothetical protein